MPPAREETWPKTGSDLRTAGQHLLDDIKDAVVSVCRGLGVRDEELMADYSQDVVIRLMDEGAVYPDRNRLFGRVKVLTRGLVTTGRRKAKRIRPLAEAEAAVGGGADEIDRLARDMDREHLLGLLPDDVRAVVRLRLTGMELNEIARELNKPIATVYRRLQCAKDVLKDRL